MLRMYAQCEKGSTVKRTAGRFNQWQRKAPAEEKEVKEKKEVGRKEGTGRSPMLVTQREEEQKVESKKEQAPEKKTVFSVGRGHCDWALLSRTRTFIYTALRSEEYPP